MKHNGLAVISHNIMDGRRLPQLLATYSEAIPLMFAGRNLGVACIQENVVLSREASATATASSSAFSSAAASRRPRTAGDAIAAALDNVLGGTPSCDASAELVSGRRPRHGKAKSPPDASTGWMTSSVPSKDTRLVTLFDGNRFHLAHEAIVPLPMLRELSWLEMTYIKGGAPELKHALVSVLLERSERPAAADSAAVVVANFHLDSAGDNKHRARQLEAVGLAVAATANEWAAQPHLELLRGLLNRRRRLGSWRCRLSTGAGEGEAARRRVKPGEGARQPTRAKEQRRGVFLLRCKRSPRHRSKLHPTSSSARQQRRSLKRFGEPPPWQLRPRPRKFGGGGGGWGLTSRLRPVVCVVAGDTNCFAFDRKQQQADLAGMVHALNNASSPTDVSLSPLVDLHEARNGDTHWFARTDEDGLGHRAARLLGTFGLDAPRRYDIIAANAPLVPLPLPPPPPPPPSSRAFVNENQRTSAASLNAEAGSREGGFLAATCGEQDSKNQTAGKAAVVETSSRKSGGVDLSGCGGSAGLSGASGVISTPDSDHDLVWAHLDLSAVRAS